MRRTIHTANRCPMAIAKPIASGADPLTLGALKSSQAAAYTTRTNANVMTNSIANPRPALSLPDVTIAPTLPMLVLPVTA